MEIDYFAEAWEDQHDFHYLNDYVTVIQNVSAFQVNPAVKAKFRYPSSDPTPNEIEDERTDAQKVQDILRIWAQILKPEEQTIWNQIAERDISKQVSLQSGMRLPKAFIERDIHSFRDIGKTEK